MGVVPADVALADVVPVDAVPVVGPAVPADVVPDVAPVVGVVPVAISATRARTCTRM